MFAFIFMDLNMPILDGMRATQRLRVFHENGLIDLSNTKIYMHSAIQDQVNDEHNVFDGVRK